MPATLVVVVPILWGLQGGVMDIILGFWAVVLVYIVVRVILGLVPSS